MLPEQPETCELWHHRGGPGALRKAPDTLARHSATRRIGVSSRWLARTIFPAFRNTSGKRRPSWTQYRDAVIFEWPNFFLCSSSTPTWKPAHFESVLRLAQLLPQHDTMCLHRSIKYCDGRSCAASNAGATLSFAAKRIVRTCQTKKKKEASCWRLCDLTIPWVSLGLYDRVLALFAEIARCSELHV